MPSGLVILSLFYSFVYILSSASPIMLTLGKTNEFLDKPNVQRPSSLCSRLIT